MALLVYYPDRPIKEVTPDSVVNELSMLAPATFNRYVAVMKAALRLAYRSGWLERPLEVMSKRAPSRVGWLTREQASKFVTALPKQVLRDMAEFTLATGLRWANVRDLEWSEVNLTKRTLHLPAHKMKAGVALMIPLSSSAMRVLHARKNGSSSTPQTGSTKCMWVFPGPNGKPYSEVIETVQRAAKTIGLPWVTWHVLRHTWASWHVQNGTPLPVLQKLGGWATLNMVMRYAHLGENHLTQWANNVNGGDDVQAEKHLVG